MLTFGAGNAIGVIIGGLLGHFAYKRDVRGTPLIMGISLILGCIPFYFFINYVDNNTSVSAMILLFNNIVAPFIYYLMKLIYFNADCCSCWCHYSEWYGK